MLTFYRLHATYMDLDYAMSTIYYRHCTIVLIDFITDHSWDQPMEMCIYGTHDKVMIMGRVRIRCYYDIGICGIALLRSN